MQEKHQIRSTIRKQRRAMSAIQLRKSAQNIARSARHCRQLWGADKVLSYEPFDGEASPLKITAQLPLVRPYLPKITNYRLSVMRFYRAGVDKGRNRYGISEPTALSQPATANELSLILMPLVAFDRSGNRIGMGAGFYDRALESLAHQKSTKPLIIGLAHHFQEVEAIQASSWDIKLDAILTDREYIPISPNLSI